MTSEPRWYGVSTGDGNDGVSHMFPDYYVLTDDPWELCRKAAASSLKPDVEFEVDGDAEYCIQAVVFDDPSFYDDYDEDADYSNWESGPAPFLLDVFPVDPEEVEKAQADPYGRTCYASIEEALGQQD